MLALVDHYSEQFRQSFVNMFENTVNFNPEQCSAQTISEITGLLAKSSKEASRGALESFLQNCERSSPPRDRSKDAVVYRYNRTSQKSFLTLFGRITLDRHLYYPADDSVKKKAYCPFDDAWEMSERFATPEVVEPILMASASMDPQEIKALLDKLGAFSLSKEAIYDIRTDEGTRIHEWVQTHEGLQTRLEAVDTPEGTEALVVGMDGVNLALREAGTKRGRPPERPKNELEPTKPKQSCFKNAMIGSFSHYGTTEVIDIKTGQPRTETVRLNSCYIAQMPQERFGDFKKEFESTLDHLELQLPKTITKMLLLDGGRPLWGYLADQEERFADYEKLLDYFHTTEHLSLASEALFGKKSKAGLHWYRKWCTKLKAEEWAVDGLIRSLEYYRRNRKLGKASSKVYEQQLGFFKRNRQWMNYANFLNRNLPIGSGPTEAACKTIVKERMCRSGMRWTRSKGKSVLTLRAIHKSKQWDQTWNEYRRQCWNKAA